MAKKNRRLPGIKVPDDGASKRFLAQMVKESAQGKRANTKVPEQWTGGENRWSGEERARWDSWMANPKGTDMHQATGSRSRPISIGQGGSSVDELYKRMVKRGMVSG